MGEEARKSKGRKPGVRLDSGALREQRLHLAYTQADLADRAGVALRTVKNAEAGRGISTLSAECITTALNLHYPSVLRPPPDHISRRLHLAGYAPLPHRGPWVGRDALMTRLAGQLDHKQGCVSCLVGPPGVGKSTLMRRLSSELRDRFPDGIIWARAQRVGDRAQRLAIQRDIARTLRFESLLPQAERVSPEAFDDAFATRLFSQRRLLILDTLDDLTQLQRFIPTVGPRWIVAATGRRQRTTVVDWHLLAVPPLDPGASRALLADRAGDARLAAEPDATEALLAACQGLPGRLEEAGRELSRDPATRIADLAARKSAAAETGR